MSIRYPSRAENFWLHSHADAFYHDRPCMAALLYDGNDDRRRCLILREYLPKRLFCCRAMRRASIDHGSLAANGFAALLISFY